MFQTTRIGSRPAFGIAFLALLTLLLTAGTARATDEVHLTSGEVLRGTVVEQDGSRLVLQHPMFGTLEIPSDQVSSILVVDVLLDEETAPAEPPAETTEAPADEGEAPPPAEEPPAPPKEWTLDLDLGLSSASGNTEEQVVVFNLEASRVTVDTRLRIDASYYNKVSDSDVTDNKFTSGLVHDWLLPRWERWFWFAGGRFDYDQFESWRFRVNAQTGPGYHLIMQENFELDLRGGLGVRKEWESSNDDAKLEAVLGGDLTWQINDRQTLTASALYFPALDDFNDFRTRSTVQWRMRMTQRELWNLTFRLGLTHEYQSIVEPDRERNDFRVSAGIGVEY